MKLTVYNTNPSIVFSEVIETPETLPLFLLSKMFYEDLGIRKL